MARLDRDWNAARVSRPCGVSAPPYSRSSCQKNVGRGPAASPLFPPAIRLDFFRSWGKIKSAGDDCSAPDRVPPRMRWVAETFRDGWPPEAPDCEQGADRDTGPVGKPAAPLERR